MKDGVERKVYHITVDEQIICGQRKTAAAHRPNNTGVHRECKRCRRILTANGSFAACWPGINVSLVIT